MNEKIKADVMDSLHYLTEINGLIRRLKNQTLSQDTFLEIISKRRIEVGSISDARKTQKIMNELNNYEFVEKSTVE